MRLPDALERSLVLRRVARRAGLRSSSATAWRPPVDRPVGVKLELTYRCNLRCGFCFTDSPRRTLEGTVDMPDAAWRRIVDEAIELGVIEAVVTGGEPLLRQPLALELIERLSDAGVAVSLNTNGWFVDDALADRLAGRRGVRVHVSVDGASAQVHDAARGVPGSWRRAVAAVDRLLARGVPVQVLHVVTPASVPTLDRFLDHMWLLGVPEVGMSTVVPIGAAARSSGWATDQRRLHRARRAFTARHGEDMRFVVEPPAVEGLATREDRPPASILVRPNGAVKMDSIHPFSVGSAEEGLAACWGRLLDHWRDPAVDEWARAVRSASKMPSAPVVPYRDPEVPLAGPPVPMVARRPERDGPLLRPPAPVAAPDLDEAQREVMALALARRYRLGEVRATGSERRDRYVRVLDTSCTFRVNATAATVMDACDDGTPGDAVRLLRSRHPGIADEQLARDTVRAVRWLEANRLLRPAAPSAPAWRS